MKVILQLARAMRSRGFRYRRIERGVYHFVLSRKVGERTAYAGKMFSARGISSLAEVLNLEELADRVKFRAEAELKRLAVA
ncbi:hypothetical protein [Sphingomonas hengshuiensis]|uniref:Addiction module toxin, HicA family n=1 Tax=Sphingomonas hengshuiensis TaxID=1609977 RepID=A0A7U4J9Y3_9SPHN|nr:hypothetical protein [Sphingomonas hengshuiensis]AJP72934.1 hypothetical protein TS85_15750 [Sphingomonas hengshuiensis]